VRRALLPFRRQLGLGARIVGAFGTNGYLGFGQGGVAIDVLLRGHPYLTTELSLQYLGSAPDGTGYARSDVPLLLSQRVNLRGPGRILAPYVVAGVGASFARVQTPTVEDLGLFLDGQAGGGVELRLGRFAALGADLRATGKLRVDGSPRETERDQLGQLREVLGSQLGLAASLTAAGYF
jgi:hypothetical protein